MSRDRGRGQGVTLLLAAVLAVATVCRVRAAAVGARGYADPLAAEHAGIIADLLAGRMGESPVAGGSDARWRPGGAFAAMQSEALTNADTANYEHFGGGAAGAPALMTELGAAMGSQAQVQDAASILHATQQQIDAAHHLRGTSAARAHQRMRSRTRAGHRMRMRHRAGHRTVMRHWAKDKLKAKAQAQSRSGVGAGARVGWPDYEGGDNEGKSQDEAVEEMLAAGSNAMHQEDMLVLDNEDYTWSQCTTWDLVEPYQSMCPTNCFSLVADPAVSSFPLNAGADESSLDPYQEEGEKTVYLFLTGHIPAVKEGEDDEESGQKAFVHPPLWLRFSSMRNNTPTEIQIGKSAWQFFRWTDLSDWDNFDLKDSGVIEALAKPDLDCIYAGSFDKEVEEEIQPKIPIVLVKPPGA